jgi:hypothetical protein
MEVLRSGERVTVPDLTGDSCHECGALERFEPGVLITVGGSKVFEPTRHYQVLRVIDHSNECTTTRWHMTEAEFLAKCRLEVEA